MLAVGTGVIFFFDVFLSLTMPLSLSGVVGWCDGAG